MARLLLDSGADRHCPANNGRTPSEQCAGGMAVQRCIAEHVAKMQPRGMMVPRSAPGSPSDKEEVKSPRPAQLDSWLRGHVSADEVEGAVRTPPRVPEEDDDQDVYEDDFEDDEDESDAEEPAAEADAASPERAPEVDAASPERGDFPLPQSSPSSSISSPDHHPNAQDPVAGVMALLNQIRAVRGETLAAVERLAPHMPQLVGMAEGFEQEANGLQDIFDRLFPNANAGVAHLQLPVDAVEEADEEEEEEEEEVGVEGGDEELAPTVEIVVTGTGLRVTERDSEPAEVKADPEPESDQAQVAAEHASQSAASGLLPPGILLGGLSAVRDEGVRDRCSHIISVCTREEFDLTKHLNPHGFSIPAFGQDFQHVVLPISDSPLQPLDGGSAAAIAPAFAAIDAWAAASGEWAVGGRSRLLIHSVHGQSRPAALLCAWLLERHGRRVSLADALAAVRALHAEAAPNFGFMMQLLRRERTESPSLRIWDYAGLRQEQWQAELARSGGELDKASARRILAASRAAARRRASAAALEAVQGRGAVAVDWAAFAEVE